jgi:hypothetical protein
MIYNFLNTTQKATLRLVNKHFYHFYWKYTLSINNYILYQRNWIPFNPPDFFEIKNIKIHTNDIYQFKKTKERKYEEINFYENENKYQERWVYITYEDKNKSRKLIKTNYGYCCNNIYQGNSKIEAWIVSKKSMFYKDKNNCYNCKKFDYCIKLKLCKTCLKNKNWKKKCYNFNIHIYICKSCYK